MGAPALLIYCYLAEGSLVQEPLAVHYDNTWNTSIATQNIKKMVTKLGIDLETYVIDNQEQDDIVLSFFQAGIWWIGCSDRS